MTLNVATNVRIGRVKVYFAAASTADPVDVVMPTTGWTYMGWMADATALLSTSGQQEIVVDDEIVPVDVILSSRAAGIDGSFAEFTMANLAAVQGGTLSSVAASSGHAGYDLLTLHGTDDLVRKAVLIEQMDPREVAGGTSLPIGRFRVYFPYATVAPNGNSELSRKRQAAIPFAIRAHLALDGSELLSKTYLFTAVGT